MFRLAFLLTISVLLLFFTPQYGLAQEAADLTLVTDDRTGISILIPRQIEKYAKDTKRGRNWSYRDGSLSIDTLVFESDASIESICGRLRSLPSRLIERDEVGSNRFLLTGRDAGGSRFYVVGRAGGRGVEAVSVVYAPERLTGGKAVVEKIVGSFDASHTPPVAVSRQTEISIVPNVRDIGSVTDISFSPDGQVAATSSDSGLTLWDMTSGRPVRSIERAAYVMAHSFVLGGSLVALARKDGVLEFLKARTGESVGTLRLATPGDNGPLALDASSGGETITASFANGVFVINASTRKVTGWFAIEGGPAGPVAKLVKGGSEIVALGENKIVAWDVRSRGVLWEHSLNAKAGKARFLSESRILVEMFPKECIVRESADGHTNYSSLFLIDLRQPGSIDNPVNVARACPKRGPDTDGGFVWFDGSEDGTRVHWKQSLNQQIHGWDVTARRAVAPIAVGVQGEAEILGFDRGRNRVAVRRSNQLELLSLDTGSVTGALNAQGYAANNAIVSDSGRVLTLVKPFSKSDYLTAQAVMWDIENVALQPLHLPQHAKVAVVALSRSAKRAAGFIDAETAVIFATDTGEEIRRFKLGEDDRLAGRLRISPDGKRLLVIGSFSGGAKAVALFNIADGRTELVVPDSEAASAIAFSEDGALFAIGRWVGHPIEVWDIAAKRRVLAAPPDEDRQVTSLGFSGDGKLLLYGTRDSGAYVWDIRGNRLVREFSRIEDVAGHVNFSSVAISRDGVFVAGGFTQRAVSSGDMGAESGIIIWDGRSGKPLFKLQGHEGGVGALTFSSEDRWLASASFDGTIRYWDVKSGRVAVTFATSESGDWVAMTARGFFSGSPGAAGLLSVVRGFEVTRIDQVWQSLYSPDLVREFVLGDKRGDFEAASSVLDLRGVLDSGRPPDVEIAAPRSNTQTTSDLIEVSAKISDAGGGMGRVEWRVNGVTAATNDLSNETASRLTIEQSLALDHGSNIIEVVAYNRRNMLASAPAAITLSQAAPAAPTKPNLYILAIGINNYADRGWTPPGSAYRLSFAPLELAAPDAERFATEMRRAGAGLYGDVKVTLALNEEATLEKQDAAIERIGRDITPRDTFIFFAAAHGTTEDGRFYLIPQDYQGGPDSLAQRAIGQETLQNWLANRIRARKAVVFLDTCESGALVSGYLHRRASPGLTEAGLGRLHEATGRPVFTAAAAGQFAHEGVIAGTGARQGIFTWAVLDALRNGDINNDGFIELSEIVTTVQASVPKLAGKLGGAGRALIRTREPVLGDQSPRIGYRGEDFVIVKRLP